MSVYDRKAILRIEDATLPGFSKLKELIQSKQISLGDIGIGGRTDSRDYKTFKKCNCNWEKLEENYCEHYYEFRRFLWRFRLAQHDVLLYVKKNSKTNIEHIAFDKRAGTGAAYNQLNRFFMIWASYEKLVNMFGMTFKDFVYNVDQRKLENLCNYLRKMDEDWHLMNHLVKHAHSPYSKNRLNKFRHGQDSFFIYYCEELRHMFIHGNLTANPNKMPARNFSLFLKKLNDFLIREIRLHFKRLASKY